jgi:glycosyltransferase involved in cell wall biosynthesis
MKISVFFDIYRPIHETKDPGQIPLGLMEIGINSGIITVTKKDLSSYQPKFSFAQQSQAELNDTEFWRKNDSDAIIAYPLQGPSYSPLIEKMKLAKKKVLLKFDSDGRIAFPLQRHYHRIPLRERLTIKNLVSDVWWYLPFKSLKQRKHAGVAAETIKQIELSDGAIIESPDALSNLNFFLAYWGRSDLIKKNHFIPNPVTPEFVEGQVGAKENIVVSHGRWDDFTVKNTFIMMETIVEFLQNRLDYRAVIFGSGTELIKSSIKDVPQEVADRISISGYVEHEKVKDILRNAKVLFVPSRWESFSIAAAEAVCTGCSIVGTPVEALRYQSMQGFSGSISATFDKKAILAALLQDANKWDQGKYDQEKIAAYWRPILNRKSVAKNIETLAKVS